MAHHPDCLDPNEVGAAHGTRCPVRPAPDPDLPWARRVLLRVEVGSTAHDTGIPGEEDYDEIGVMALPWEWTLGIPRKSERNETIVYRPGRRPYERSGPGDYDLTVHSARKVASLASHGNPSILMVLFGPVRYTTPLGDRLRELAPAFWHQDARHRFAGYLKSQRERLEGSRGGKHTNRPELVDVHGYDTKYAMHTLRLGYQGIEYMTTGRLTVPIRDEVRDVLRAVRRGEKPLEWVLRQSELQEASLREMPSDAPVSPDFAAINAWLRDVHETYADRPITHVRHVPG